jgi:hypothetical protein
VPTFVVAILKKKTNPLTYIGLFPHISTNIKSTARSEVQPLKSEVLNVIFSTFSAHLTTSARYLSLIVLLVLASLILQHLDQRQWKKIYRYERLWTGWDALRISESETKSWNFSSKICTWVGNFNCSIECYVNKTHVLCVCLGVWNKKTL